ncbi:cold shock domain-containing protein [Niastella caeni]|uniref:Cold shock domain-containing protein n=1 Tax=Niastella caeni TaxID=2569763 RepID=A0A4S8HEQ9_9BACT|nr:cold shock domain-containing protein [Niastella caeni]THU31112.1 cold shock domain-containing protein [Niastella caeni]
MGKSQETVSKKEREKQRARKQQEKREKMQERKHNKEKGKSLNDMIAYLDENGNISANPPDPRKRRVFIQEEIQVSVPKQEHRQQVARRTGIVTYYNQVKGFGFINEDETKQRIFVHSSQLAEPVMENDRVQFEIENSHKGPSAIHLSKI